MVTNQQQRPQQQQQPHQRSRLERLRLRPIDAGLNVNMTPDMIDRRQSPAMRDVFFYKNELRKPPGSNQLGMDFPDPVLWQGTWERFDGVNITLVTITQKHLYYWDKLTSAWIQVPPDADIATLTGDPVERYSVVFYNDIMYLVSKHNPIRYWDGTTSGGTFKHILLAGGYAARGMEVINGHIVLVGTTSGATFEAQTVRWSSTASPPSFSGLGSGANVLSDRQDTLQNIRKLGPYRGLAYKTQSIQEIRATGDAANPFEFTEFVGNLGLLMAFSLAEGPQGHFFCGTDEQVYLYNGFSLRAIGDDIRHEMFPLLQDQRLDTAFGFYDNLRAEYFIHIPSSTTTGCNLYYAYNLNRKRWRSGIFKEATWASNSFARAGATWDEEIGTWDQATDIWDNDNVTASRQQTVYATYTKRVFRLDTPEVVLSAASFDGAPYQFQFSTADIIGDEDGEEVTLQQVKIGYIVAGTQSLTLEVSVDSGNTWTTIATNVLGVGLATGAFGYSYFTPMKTAQSIRCRISNS